VSDAHKFHCPACNRRYRWTPQLAGRKSKCKCGVMMRAPAAPGQPPEQLSPTTKASASASEPGSTAHEASASERDPLAPEPAASQFDWDSDDFGYELSVQEGDIGGGAAKPEPSPPAPESAPPPAEGDESYDLAVDDGGSSAATAEVHAKYGGKCPNCNQSLKEGAVICLNCGFNLLQGKKLETAVGVADDAGPVPAGAIGAKDALSDEDNPEHKWTELYIPLILLGSSLLVFLVGAFLSADPEVFADLLANATGPAPSEGALYAMAVGFNFTLRLVQLLLTAPVIIVACIFISSIFSTDFGPVGTALLKMLSMGATLIASEMIVGGFVFWLTEGGVMGMEYIFTFAITFGVFYVLAMKLLDLDAMETIVLYLFVYFVPWVLLFFGGVFLLWLVFAIFG